MRSFAQIMEQEKATRNILEIKTIKKTESSSRGLTFDDTKQIKLKPGISTDTYLTEFPIMFKDHEVSVKKQLNNVTRVTLKNVPLNVPDEEIINLCLSYGRPLENKVSYEVLTNTRNRGHTGSTR